VEPIPEFGLDPTSAGKRVCIQWPKFGPYHVARLSAAGEAAKSLGFEGIGLETAGRDLTYGFSAHSSSGCRRTTVYPEHALEELNPKRIRHGITAALNRLDPVAVGIMSYSFPDARACLKWCKDNRRIAILMSSSKEDDAQRRPWRERVKSVLVKGFDAALVGGTAQRSYLEQLGFSPSGIFRGYNVVDSRHFQEGAERARANPGSYAHLPGLADRTPFFLASGRMIHRKNFVRLLNAYSQYRTSLDNPWRLVIVGDGPRRDALVKLIRSARIDGVTLAGFRTYDEMPAYYGLASALVHPAVADQWALVVNEAMAAGLPVAVSSGCGCASDLVRNGENGFVFDPTDEDKLTHILKTLSLEPDRLQSMAKRSAEIISEWGPDLFGRGFVRALEYAMGRKRRSASIILSATLMMLRSVARRADSFHTVEA